MFLVGVCETQVPDQPVADALDVARPRSCPAPLRGDAVDLPQLAGRDKAALDAYQRGTRAHEAEEELRLGYVAFTRAAHLLSVSSYHWSPPRPRRSARRAYQRRRARAARASGASRSATGWTSREGRRRTRYAAVDPPRPWPVTEHRREALRRLEAAARVQAADPAAADDGTRPDRGGPRSPTGTTSSSGCWPRRGPTAADVVESRCRRSLSATALARLRDDPEAFARDLARPMPRPPSPAARFGTRFHAWVEARFGQQDLFDPDELPGRADAGIDDDADLERADRGRSRRARSPTACRYAVEAPFALVLGGQVVRGRIDAVYEERRRVPRRRLEDQPAADRRPAPARDLPPGLGRAARRPGRAGAGRVLLRPHRRAWSCHDDLPGSRRAGAAGQSRLSAAVRAISTIVAEGLLALLRRRSPRR